MSAWEWRLMLTYGESLTLLLGYALAALGIIAGGVKAVRAWPWNFLRQGGPYACYQAGYPECICGACKLPPDRRGK